MTADTTQEESMTDGLWPPSTEPTVDLVEFMRKVRGVTLDGRWVEVEVADGALMLEGKDLFLVRRYGDGAVETWPVHIESPSERVRREARARLAEKRAVKSRLVMAAELRAVVPEALRPVIDLHSPNSLGDCVGCDVGDDEYSDRPVWPCRTIDLIREKWLA